MNTTTLQTKLFLKRVLMQWRPSLAVTCERTFHKSSADQQKSKLSAVDSVVKEQDFPFSGARLGTFVQEAPKLGNQFLEDALLQSYLKRYLPEQVKF